MSYGFYLNQNELIILKSQFRPTQVHEFYDYRGATNVRTSLSNGSSTPAEVINDAKKAGLDFLFLTDLNQNEYFESYDGYYGNLLVSAQGEYNYMDMRLLHFSTNKDNPPKELNAQRLYFTDILTQNLTEKRDSHVYLAHPLLNGPTWIGNFPIGVNGIEILNPKRISQLAWKTSKLSVLWSLICYPFNSTYSFLRLFKEPREEISTWDKVLSERKVVGFSGVDASAKAIPFASYLMKFPSYQKSFEITSNHILLESELTGKFNTDRIKLFDAFKKGQLYFSLDLLGDPKGFVSYLQNSDKKHMIGSTVPFNKNLKLVAKLPEMPNYLHEIIVFKNGEFEKVSNDIEMIYDVKSPGIYRFVIRVSIFLPIPDAKNWITWIYTNPYFIN